MIHTLRLRVSNVHLAVGKRPVLFDTGSPGEALKILQWLQSLGHAQPAAIILTHAHADHAGNALALRQATGAPVGLGAGDLAMAAAGMNMRLRPTRLSAIPLAYLVPARFAPFAPDFMLEDGMTLADLGLDAQLIATPGHTAGSFSTVFADGAAIIGDMLMGGFLGSALMPQRPRPHYFADDPARNAASLARLLSYGIKGCHVGHGGPLPAASLHKFAATHTQPQSQENRHDT